MLIPIHRRVLPRCLSKFFTRSVVFATQYEARLPLVPFGLDMTMRQDSLYVTACSFASPQYSGAFTGAPSLGSHHQMPASYEAAWSLPRLDFHQQVVPSLARRAIAHSLPVDMNDTVKPRVVMGLKARTEGKVRRRLAH